MAGRIYTAEEVAQAIFQDSGSEFGGYACDFEDSQADNSDFQASSLSESADSEPEPEHAAARPIPVRHLRNRRDRQAAQIEWEHYEDVDPYESVWLQDYNERQGILVDTTNFTPVDFFYLFMPEAAFELISVETNRYAMQYLDDTADPPPRSRFLSWIDTSKAEIKALIALQIAMGLCQKRSIPSYWNKFWLTYTPFNSIMSRNRFELIQTFLHFNNAELQVPRGQRGFNPLFKIQPLLDIVDPTYMQVYGPRRELSLDELLSTIDNNLTLEKNVRSRENDTGYRTVEKPVIAEQYKHFMGGVDTLDQLLGAYQYPHESQKWYHTIYHRVREVALVNGFIVYRKAHEINKLDLKQFRQAVIDGLLKNWQPPRKKVGRPSLLPELRLTERHFPDKYENPKFKPECRACSDRQAGRQVQTRFFCKQCAVPLCIVPCFERYHTLKDYKS